MKEVNKNTSNEFHDWQRANLPKNFVIWDIDSWPLVISDPSKEYEPLALIELKRSSFEPSSWTPFKADQPNYLALFRLAQKANIPCFVIYFKKGKSLLDSDAKLALFKIKGVMQAERDWMIYDKKMMSPNEFASKFPSILS
jgi:hypothetical protein